MTAREQIESAVKEFAHKQIDSYFASQEKTKLVDFAVGKIKHIANNIVEKNLDRLDSVLYCITDKDGKINIGSGGTDAVIEAFEEFPMRNIEVAGIRMQVGQGEVRIALPTFPMCELVYGDDRIVTMGVGDLRELIEVLSNNIE